MKVICRNNEVLECSENHRLEMLENLSEGEAVSFCRQGEYADLCENPHISNTCHIRAVRLLSVAGTYWKGDEKNKMYGSLGRGAHYNDSRYL